MSRPSPAANVLTATPEPAQPRDVLAELEELTGRVAALERALLRVVGGSSTPQDAEILSVEETAEFLRMDRKSVYAAIRAGNLPILQGVKPIRICKQTLLKCFRVAPRQRKDE